MKSLKLVLFALIGLLTGTTGISQENYKNDIGFIISTNSQIKIGLEYRLNINDHWQLRLGGFYGSRNSYPFNDGQVIEVSDSLITNRRHQFRTNYMTLEIGGQRRFRSSMFSLSTDLLFTYNNSRETYSNNYTVLDSTGEWNHASYNLISSSFPDLSGSNAQVIRHYLSPQLVVGVLMDIPINSRFAFSLGISGIAGTNIFIQSTDEVDPLNEFNDPAQFSFNFSTSVNAGIRYRFGKDKN